jgi:hypothetical protein
MKHRGRENPPDVRLATVLLTLAAVVLAVGVIALMLLIGESR